MSVPLDRLYTFLRDLCDQDIIIYRWYPHGSRKTADCRQLDPNITEFDKITVPHMICHDQEPLNFDWFSGNKNRLLHSLTFNRLHLYDKMLLCHSEKRSLELERFENNDAIGVYWWCHALIAIDWFRYARHDQSLRNKDIQKDFLVYNRAWSGTREYRLKFAEMVLNQKLDQQCLMGFNPIDQDQHYSKHTFKNTKLSTTYTNFENYFFINNTPSSASADFNVEDYQQTGIEVVLETLFDDSRWHLTEKTLRPIACGQPFILASTPGSLEYLRSYGFQTFGTIIDETYDTVTDPLDRLTAIVEVMQTIATHRNKNKLYKDLQQIAQYNQHRFFSTEFYNTIVEEFCKNFQLGINKLSSQINPLYFKTQTKALKSVAELTSTTKFTREDLLKAWLWIKART